MYNHILQSPLWARFKNEYGTPAISSGGVVYTKHNIPFTNSFYAYCPRVNPFIVDFEELRRSLKENSCIALHFDVPNVVRGSEEESEAVSIFDDYCIVSSRDEFAKGNFLLDLTLSEKEILNSMHKKQRYNIRYSERKGVKVRVGYSDEDFQIFYKLYKETAERQKYYFRIHTYLEKMWGVFNEVKKAHILIAEYKGTPLASWMLIDHEDVIYYPYGGSSEDQRNLQASCLVGWESIKFGKKLGAHLFDMWGAADNLEDPNDPYTGFTSFKAKFGGKHVVYIDSFDLVINKSMYKIFLRANNLRWKLLKLVR